MKRKGQRQDSLTDQMRDVLRYAVESGCYDAHDWLVARWGTRNGNCTATTKITPERTAMCDLTVHHEGAHFSNMGWYGEVKWVEPQVECPCNDDPGATCTCFAQADQRGN